MFSPPPTVYLLSAVSKDIGKQVEMHTWREEEGEKAAREGKELKLDR